MNSGTVTRADKDFNLTEASYHTFTASTWTGKGSQYWRMPSEQAEAARNDDSAAFWVAVVAT
jgi:hypothetical protein